MTTRRVWLGGYFSSIRTDGTIETNIGCVTVRNRRYNFCTKSGFPYKENQTKDKQVQMAYLDRFREQSERRGMHRGWRARKDQKGKPKKCRRITEMGPESIRNVINGEERLKKTRQRIEQKKRELRRLEEEETKEEGRLEENKKRASKKMKSFDEAVTSNPVLQFVLCENRDMGGTETLVLGIWRSLMEADRITAEDPTATSKQSIMCNLIATSRKMKMFVYLTCNVKKKLFLRQNMKIERIDWRWPAVSDMVQRIWQTRERLERMTE